MKTVATLFFALVTAVCLSGVPAWAQHGGGGHPGGPPPSGMPSTGPGGGMGHEGRTGTNSGMMNRSETPSDILSRNTRLSSRVSTLSGMDAQKACQGFKNLGQCVAAAEVSHNLGISFASLKDRMMGGASLGKAIHTLNPKVNSKAEARKAEKQANRDIRQSGS